MSHPVGFYLHLLLKLTLALLDGVKVVTSDIPGGTSLNNVASITVQKSTLVVEVWDQNVSPKDTGTPTLTNVSTSNLFNKLYMQPTCLGFHLERQQVQIHCISQLSGNLPSIPNPASYSVTPCLV